MKKRAVKKSGDAAPSPPPPPPPPPPKAQLIKAKKKKKAPTADEPSPDLDTEFEEFGETEGVNLLSKMPSKMSKENSSRKGKDNAEIKLGGIKAVSAQVEKARDAVRQTQSDYRGIGNHLNEIRNFKKATLKTVHGERPDSDDDEDEEKTLPRNKPQTLDYKKLYTHHLTEGAEALPIHKLKFIILQVDSRAENTLNFTGVSVLTDITFALLADLKQKENARLNAVTSVILDGCHQVTDAGVQWLGKAFHNLSSLSLVGCGLVTDASIFALCDLCPKLISMDLSGTQVTFLPPKWAGAEGMRMTCTPLLYPIAPADAKKGKKGPLKPEGKDLFCLFIAHHRSAEVSVLAALKGEKQPHENKIPNVQYHSAFSVNSDLTAFIVESEQCLAPFFISNRSVVVLPCTLKDKTKMTEEATSIASLIIQIVTKQPNTQFLLVGCSTDAQGIVPVDFIKDQVLDITKKFASVIKKRYPVLAAFSENVGVEKQLEMSRYYSLMEKVENLNVTAMEINVDKDCKELLTAVGRVAKELILIKNSSYDKDIYDWASAFPSKCPKELKSGIVTLNDAANVVAANSNFKERMRPFGAVHFLSNIGQFSSWSNPDKVTYVANNDWICPVLDMLMTVDRCGEKNNGQSHVIEDEVPVWMMDKLKVEMDKMKADWKQVENVLKMNSSVFFSNESMVTPWVKLPLNPLMPVDNFTDFDKDSSSDQCLHIMCSFALDANVTPALLHSILSHAIKLHAPIHVWQTGVVINDGVVAVMIGLAGYSKLLNLCAYMPDHSKDSKHLSYLIWSTLNRYKLVIRYFLAMFGLAAEEIMRASQKLMPPPEKTDAVLSGHKISDEIAGMCANCGVLLSEASLLNTFKKTLEPSFCNSTCLQIKTLQGQVNGSVIEIDGPCTVNVKSVLDPFGNSSCSFSLLQGNVRLLKISFICHKVDSIVTLDFKQSKLIHTAAGSETKEDLSKKLGEGTLQGSVVRAQLRNQGVYYMDIFMGQRLMHSFQVPCGRYSIKLDSTNFTEGNLAAVSISDSNFAESSLELKKGMRLEALDRKNPSLICVATIEEIKGDEVHIHFDGWTDRYDYWTNFDHQDLHPLGFMEHMDNIQGHKTRVNTDLQAPNGYTKKFTWPTYLEEIEAEPVPYDMFNEAQLRGTPPTQTEEVMDYIGLSFKMGVSHCYKMIMRSSRIRKSLKEHLKVASEKEYLKEDNFNWYTFLPNNLSLQTLRYPVLKDIFDIKKMNIHFLCDWQGLEFHFVNHPGIAAAKTSFEKVDKWTLLHLESCVALMLQKQTLPSDPSVLISGTANIAKDKINHLELGLRRLYQTYIMYALLLQDSATKLDQTAFDSVLESAKEIVTTSMQNDKQFAQNFHFKPGTDGLLCQAHKLADSPQADFQEIKIENFQGLCSRIYTLNFNGNPLSSLPEDLFTHFLNLTQLYLNKCNITELPPFAQNACLEVMDVRSNKLTSLPDDVKQLQNLRILQISNNPLEILPPVISSLVSLIHLAADNIGKVDMNIVCSLPNLEYLSLSFNHIDDLPDKLSSLPLQTLYMAGLPVIGQGASFAPSSINSLLDSIVIYNRILAKDRQEMIEKADNAGDKNVAKIADFNNQLRQKYPQFGKIKGHKDGDVPQVFFKLKKLQKLHVSNHSFITVPDTVKQLTSLQSLNLESNFQLESVSAELANLPLKELHLRDCPMLKTPPKEVVRRGFLAVFGFLKRLLQGSVLCKRTKLMMVGLGGAGKTSLVRALTHKSFSYYEDHGENITDGIDITEWSVDTKKFKQVVDESSNEPLRFSVWDFAGQTVYYNTHQFFLSNRAVYLLLWNIRLGFEHAGLDFWLSSVACHAPKAPIIVIGTHCDKVERGKLPTEELKRKFPKIMGFHFVSSYSGEGIDDLRLEVIKSALTQEYMGEKIPEAWLSLEIGLDKARGKKSLVKWEEIEDIANISGIFDKIELIQSVQFLHDLGSVQFFNTAFLKSHVVIVPQWIVDVMACIVTVHDGPTKDGRLSYKDMATVWQDYPKELHPWLLRLTEEFDLTFPLTNEEANIVPCLLSNSEPKYEFATVNKDKREREARMVYQFEYLPAGLFNRAQARLHQFSDTSLMWKKGFMLKKNDHRALLLQVSNTEVAVTARGFKPENILFLIHEVIECLISDSYSGVSYDFSLPCLECADDFTLEPSMFHASKIKRAFDLKAPFLQCDKHFHVISIPEIQAAMPPDRNSDFDEHLGRSVRELQELQEGVVIKCFFIYSKKNIPDLAQEGKVVNPTEVLADLRKEGFNVSYCDDPENANMESMTLAIKSAQIVIIGISDDFVKSEQCKNLIIYVKQTLNKNILLLVLGSTLAWQKTDINLVLADEVFVQMTQVKSYSIKLKEMIEAIKTRVSKKKVTYPECFISYCWANSHAAVELGTPKKEGALGWADPRKIKEFLQSKGVNCWLDVNQMGQEGFFEDIADGLRKAKVMVACVSDEYAISKNCKMEFRFALSTLKIPTVLAVVGTGYAWERSEIGLLTVGHSNSCPKLNLQYENEGGMLDLLKSVQSFIPVTDTKDNGKGTNVKTQQDAAFQEVLELAQRKLLRQIGMYADNLDTEPYPRLIIVDLKIKDEGQRPRNSRTPRKKEKEKNDEKLEEKTEEPAVEPIEDDREKSDSYCFRLFCEHEMGWHESPEIIPFPAKENLAMSDFLNSVSAYAVRLMAILNHAKINLPVFNTPAGEQLQRKMEEWCNRTNSDFESEYQTMLDAVLDEDVNRTFGGLKRCNMPNKKILWLCPEHEKKSLTQTDEKYKDNIQTENDTSAPVNQPESDVETDSMVETASFISETCHTDIPEEEPEVSSGAKVRSVTLSQPGRGPALPPSRPKLNRHTSGKKTTSQACRLM